MCNPLVNHYLKYISDKSKPLVKASESILFFPDCCKERISNLPSAQSTNLHGIFLAVFLETAPCGRVGRQASNQVVD